MAYSSKPSPGTVYFEAGSQANIDDLIAAQDRARANTAANAGAAGAAKSWAPWIVGGLLIGGAVWWVTRG